MRGLDGGEARIAREPGEHAVASRGGAGVHHEGTDPVEPADDRVARPLERCGRIREGDAGGEVHDDAPCGPLDAHGGGRAAEGGRTGSDGHGRRAGAGAVVGTDRAGREGRRGQRGECEERREGGSGCEGPDAGRHDTFHW